MSQNEKALLDELIGAAGPILSNIDTVEYSVDNIHLSEAYRKAARIFAAHGAYAFAAVALENDADGFTVYPSEDAEFKNRITEEAEKSAHTALEVTKTIFDAGKIGDGDIAQHILYALANLADKIVKPEIKAALTETWTECAEYMCGKDKGLVREIAQTLSDIPTLSSRGADEMRANPIRTNAALKYIK